MAIWTQTFEGIEPRSVRMERRTRISLTLMDIRSRGSIVSHCGKVAFALD
jgi:hypothetical protein